MMARSRRMHSAGWFITALGALAVIALVGCQEPAGPAGTGDDNIPMPPEQAPDDMGADDVDTGDDMGTGADPVDPPRIKTDEHGVGHISDPDDFQAYVLDAKTPVLVDFYANWCKPCDILAPTMVKIHDQYEGRAAVYKVNVDNAKALARKYSIRSIPLVILFVHGEIAEQWVGVRPESTYTAAVDAALQ